MKSREARSRRTSLLLAFSALAMACSGAYRTDVIQPSGSDPSVPADSRRVVEITTTGINLSYSVAEIEAKAGEQLTIRYVNESETLPHNIVLVKEEGDIRPVGIAALKAHANDYIPEGEMDRIIAYSELAHPGDTVEFTFTVPPPGMYPYICTYSGHFTMMQGRLISTE